MRSLLAALGLTLLSSGALAADFGVGIAARSEDDGSLYVPIDIADRFRLEPSFRYAHTESDRGIRWTKVREFGLGAFALANVVEQGRLYYGARLGYVDWQDSYIQSHVVRVTQTWDGWSIAPTVGAEYLFGNHFSVGGEIAYSFTRLDGHTRTYMSSTQDRDVQGTQTRLIVRYTF